MNLIFMCKPCAVSEKEAGKKVELEAGRSEKNTCEVCGRRRFCCLYTVRDKKGSAKDAG